MTGGARRRLAVGAVLAAAGLGLSSCASGAALGLARSACTHVDRSIRLYDTSLRADDPATAAADQAAAVAQLEAGQPDAATAAGEDAQWQALMTTISESPRISERYLVYALQQQCAVADSPGGQGMAPSTPAPPLPPSNTAVPTSSSSGTTTSPGTTSPGTTSPGTTSPGTTSPGTTSPGTTSPGTTSPGTTSPSGSTSPGS